MPDPRAQHDDASPSDIAALVVRFLDGRITDAEFTQLESLLATDPDARAVFVELSRQSQTLREIETESADASEDAVESETSRSPGTPISAAGVPMYRKGCEPQPFKLRAHHYAFAAAALLVACGLAAYLLTTSVDRQPDPVDPNPPGPSVATLIHNTGNLRTPADYPVEGEASGPGEYSLSTGTAEFMLTNAVNVKLRGDTRMVMHNDMNVALTRGTAEFVVPKDATGFSVLLPRGGRVVDLGTRFICDVRNGQSMVYVVEGLVELTDASNQTRGLTTDQVCVIGTDGTITPLGETDHPLAQWLRLRRDTLQDPALVFDLNYAVRERSDDPAVRFNLDDSAFIDGRRPGNHAIRFDGDARFVELDQPTASDALTLETWVRVHSLDRVLNTLIAATYRTDGLHLFLRKDGRLTSSLFADPTPVPILGPSHFDRWTHLVLSIDADSVAIYRGGKPIAEMKRTAPGAVLLGETRIANWNNGDYPFSDKLRGLHADIDTFTLLARPMSADEVLQRFDAGRTTTANPQSKHNNTPTPSIPGGRSATEKQTPSRSIER